MHLIGQSAVICLSFSGLCHMLLQLQCYQKTKQFKKCPIVVPQAQTLLTSLIILVDLTMLILSDKLLLDIQLMHTFMPNMIHKPWMVSIKYVSIRCTKTSLVHMVACFGQAGKYMYVRASSRPLQGQIKSLRSPFSALS